MLTGDEGNLALPVLLRGWQVELQERRERGRDVSDLGGGRHGGRKQGSVGCKLSDGRLLYILADFANRARSRRGRGGRYLDSALHTQVLSGAGVDPDVPSSGE